MAKVFIFYKDADYILFQKKGLIGFLGPLFCSYWVVLEARQVRVRVPPEEKAYLLSTIQHYVELGGDPVRLKGCSFFRDFSEAVVLRNHLRGRVFFEAESPLSHAQTLFDEKMRLS